MPDGGNGMIEYHPWPRPTHDLPDFFLHSSRMPMQPFSVLLLSVGNSDFTAIHYHNNRTCQLFDTSYLVKIANDSHIHYCTP